MATSAAPATPAPSAPPLEHDWAANQRIRWYRSPIPMSELRALSQRRTLRPLLHALGFIALLTASGSLVVLAERHLSWPWLIAALFLHGSLFRTLQHSRHELSHRTVFRSRLLNELFLRVFSFLHWSSPDYFRASHVRHHQYTVHDELDREVRLPRPLQPLQWLFRFVAAVPSMAAELRTLLRWSLGRLDRSGSGVTWEQHCFADRPVGQGDAAKRAALFGWARVMLLGHLALAALFIAADAWIMLLVVTFARWLAPWLSFLLVETQHAGLAANTPDHRLCCRTILLGPCTRFLYWHMNYHVEHHMFPSVPFYNLHKLRAAIAADLPPAPRGLLRAWAQMLPVLWRQRRDSGCLIVPPLPPRSPSAA